MPRTFERRSAALTNVEVRAADDTTGRLRFRGRAVVYGQMSDDLGGWTEIIEPGAATRTLAADPDVRFLINHDPNLLLARTTSGTLRLTEADDGLDVEADMADVTYARDLAQLLERGDLNQMSFGFWVTADEWAGTLHRVREFDLDGGDVAAVTFPAFPQTSAEVRAAAARALGRPVPAPNRRFVDLFSSDVRARLRSALQVRFDPTDGQWVWVYDFTDELVVFELEGYGDDTGTFQLAFSIDDGGQVQLDAGDPTAVVPTTVFSPVARVNELLGQLDAAFVLNQQRAGKVLSGDNQTLVTDAISALQALLDKATPAEAGMPLGLAQHRLRELELLTQI